MATDDPVEFTPYPAGAVVGPITITGSVTIAGQPILVTATITGQPIAVTLSNIDAIVDLLRRILATIEFTSGVKDVDAQSE